MLSPLNLYFGQNNHIHYRETVKTFFKLALYKLAETCFQVTVLRVGLYSIDHLVK